MQCIIHGKKFTHPAPGRVERFGGKGEGGESVNTSRCYSDTDKLNYFLSAFIETEWSPKNAMNLFFHNSIKSLQDF